MAWPVLARGAEALLVAPTGTGKTEAALLPLLGDLVATPGPPVSILYITPLRALNRDLDGRLMAWSEALGLRAAVRHGDTPQRERVRQSAAPPDVLVTTPETLQLLLVGSQLRKGMQNLRAVIVDEIHELASNDRGAQLAVSLDRLDALVGHHVRRIGLSATIGNPKEVATYLSPRTPVEVLVAPASKEFSVTVRPPAPPEAVSAVPEAMRSELKADDGLLAALLALVEEVRAHRSTLIFVNTRPTAESLAARLKRLAADLPVAVHHGSLSREVREETEERFRKGELRALVATSSLELGIDIGVADHVVQFGSPHQASRLLQRIGRSGHRRGAVSSGTVIALDDEDLEESVVLARRVLSREVEPISIRPRNRLALAQQLVAALRAEREVPADRVLSTLLTSVPTRDLTLGEVRELSEFLERLGSLRREGTKFRAGRGTLQRFYATLSLIPEEKTYPLRDLGSRKVIGTLDERFVVTQVLANPEFTFLLHGTTWRVVEFREEELLVEAVKEIGQEPRWAGEDIPVPFEVAQEIGRLRREGSPSTYPMTAEARGRLERRVREVRSLAEFPSDRTVTVEAHGRMMVVGACFGTKVNATLAMLLAGLATSKFGVRSDVLLVEPTWFVIGLPTLPAPSEALGLFEVDPDTVPGLLDRLVPTGMEYRWTFTTVARKFGLLPLGADARQLRTLEPLLETSEGTPLGEEALEKTLHDRYDVERAREVFARARRGELRLVNVPSHPGSLGSRVLERLRWQQLGDVPPPTLLKAVKERLRKEPLLLICVRCGYERTVTAEGWKAAGGSACRVCKGALSAIMSPRREEELKVLRKYLKARRRRGGASAPRPTPQQQKLMQAAYTTAELLSSYGEMALLALAARGVGPETARRILLGQHRGEDALLGDLLKAERSYAQTRAFWD
ncbi:MAG: DEAD/DEAH box helicase [Euryarchaeota archaeon]|nr:DEAD/DEAH box helicase [Euryarchaeota archaeon]MDE1836973.1 DEAD/DEAH box helicase [Euryarchaeota archaeon]MDE1880793.1 DEAD/DEAH box helicase [Euryarchaeota archaeon]